MEKVIYLADRSGAEMDDTCGMKYYWNRVAEGGGIVPIGDAEYLRVGKEIHEDLERIATAEDVEGEVNALVGEITGAISGGDSQKECELAYRRAGWAAAFGLYIEPRIRAGGWENVGVESELILDRGELWVPVTPDRVLRNTRTGQVIYREYKSTITASSNWLESWKYAIQLHLGMKAVEEEIGTKLAFAQIMGLMKGQERDGRLAHPYCWGYYNDQTRRWTHLYENARGSAWQPRPVWEFEEGLLAWVKICGEDTAIAQFPHTPPVFLNERMLSSWVSRRMAREAVIAAAREECLTDDAKRVIVFEPRTKNCRPAFGSACEYLPACWNATIGANPLEHGFVKRTPHHEVEINWRKENG